MRIVPSHWGWLFAATVAIVAAWLSCAVRSLGASATPQARSPQSCDVAPRSRGEIAQLLASSGIATPPATTAGQTLPAGAPADESSVIAMEAIVAEWLACQNAGEPLRAWALFSDGYLYRLLSRQGGREQGDSVSTVLKEGTDGGARLLEIRDQRVLPDGRYGATVTISYSAIPTPKTFFFFFTKLDGRLVIDGILGEISFSVP